jgi:hypothetical protein
MLFAAVREEVRGSEANAEEFVVSVDVWSLDCGQLAASIRIV